MGRNKQGCVCAIVIMLAVSAVMSGCATPPRRGDMPVTMIRGTRYIGLNDFCRARAVTTSYDPMTRVVTLAKGRHQVRMAVDDSAVLINGVLHHLRSPIASSAGSVHIPYHFYRDVLAGLFESKPMIISDYAEHLDLGAVKRIVIDAGHGGKDPGAIGRSGLYEKEVTLDIAHRLNKLLRSRGIETVMVRSTDKFVRLEDRVKIANEPGNSLFISIHANANHSRKMRGFEVYYITPRVSDTERALKSARTVPLGMEGSFAGNPSLNLKAAVWDMIHNYNRSESAALSRSICKVTGCQLDTRIIGVKSANYHVLRGSAIPAVLVEVGFLSNAAEERLLKDGVYRQRIAEAIRDGVRDFLVAKVPAQSGQMALSR